MLNEETLAAYAELSQLELIRDGMPSYSSIRDEVLTILQEIGVPSAPLLEMHEKLKLYRYCPDPDRAKEGAYTRWIDLEKLKKGEVILSKGGVLVGCTETSKGLGLLFRNFRGGVYTVHAYKLLLFQALSDDEILVGKALDYVAQ